MKEKIDYIINKNATFVRFIYILIILNVFFLILESYKELHQDWALFFKVFEIISVIIFTIEYLLRVWVANLKAEKNQSWKYRLKFIFSAYGLIDLLAILPFYLPFIFPFDLRITRILRLFRMLRVFKLGRYSKSLKLIQSVLKDTKSELSMTVFVAFILLVFSSTLMYYVEHDVQPEKFASIGHSFWWAVATLTTVGYGDVYPITGLGKVLSAVIALIGIGFVALPTGIISSAFIDKVQAAKKEKRKCPHCGKHLES